MAGVLLTQGIRSRDTYNGTIQAWLKTLTCHLFKNNHTPSVTDTNGSYTEANFDGYAAVATATWGTPTLDGNNNDHYTDVDVVFSQTGHVVTNQVYGYYFTDGSSNVVFAEANGVSGGVAMADAGYSYTVSPNWYEGQCATPL